MVPRVKIEYLILEKRWYRREELVLEKFKKNPKFFLQNSFGSGSVHLGF